LLDSFFFIIISHHILYTMDGVKYQPPAKRYIPFPATPIQQSMLNTAKRGVEAIGVKKNTSKLKSQKPIQQRRF